MEISNTKEESAKKLNFSKFIKQLPINYKSPNTLKIIGWNWRSLTMSKILYINYLIEIHNLDHIIIWETWLENKPTGINNLYEVFQTKYSKNQGVWIISRKNTTRKIYTNNEQFIIVNRDQNKRISTLHHRSIFSTKMKKKILEQLNKLINRINLIYKNPEIILFCDLNPDLDFTPELLEKKLKLKFSEWNKYLTTREQMIKSKLNTSTLDYYFSNQQTLEVITLVKNESDHYPLLATIQIEGKMKKRLTNITYSKIDINKEFIKNILNEEKWPSITYPKINKHILWKKNIIRPTVKLQQESNKIFDKKYWLEHKEITFKRYN